MSDKNESREQRSLSDYGILAGGILAGFILAAILMVKSVGLAPNGHNIEMTYVDLVVIVLAAVAVLITVLGLMLAVFAFWGITGLRKQAHETSKKTVVNSLAVGGELYELVKRTVIETQYRETGLDLSSDVEEEAPNSRRSDQ